MPISKNLKYADNLYFIFSKSSFSVKAVKYKLPIALYSLQERRIYVRWYL